jgi:hypothetical protein
VRIRLSGSSCCESEKPAGFEIGKPVLVARIWSRALQQTLPGFPASRAVADKGQLSAIVGDPPRRHPKGGTLDRIWTPDSAGHPRRCDRPLSGDGATPPNKRQIIEGYESGRRF